MDMGRNKVIIVGGLYIAVDNNVFKYFPTKGLFENMW